MVSVMGLEHGTALLHDPNTFSLHNLWLFMKWKHFAFSPLSSTHRHMHTKWLENHVNNHFVGTKDLLLLHSLTLHTACSRLLVCWLIILKLPTGQRRECAFSSADFGTAEKQFTQRQTGTAIDCNLYPLMISIRRLTRNVRRPAIETNCSSVSHRRVTN